MIQQRHHIFGIELAGVIREAAGDIQRPRNLHFIYFDCFSRFGEGAVAALFRCQIYDYRAGVHIVYHPLSDKQRCRFAGDERGCDDNIRFFSVLVYHLPLTFLLIFGLLPGVTALGFGIGVHFTDFNKFGAQAFHLFLHGGTNIKRFHHRAQSFGRGNRLQPGDSGTQNQYFSRSDGSGRGHHHGQVPVQLAGADERGFVACDGAHG